MEAKVFLGLCLLFVSVTSMSDRLVQTALSCVLGQTNHSFLFECSLIGIRSVDCGVIVSQR